MVGLLGMGTSLISVSAIEYPVGSMVSKVLSDDACRSEIEEMLARSKSSVTEMLTEHRVVIEALRDALLARNELIGQEILDVIRSSSDSVGAMDEAVVLV
jgi:ATP-dependent Zn protease